MVHPREDAQGFWTRFADLFSLSSPAEGEPYLESADVVAAKPRLFVRTVESLRAVLAFCAREKARAYLDVGLGLPASVHPAPSAPAALPVYADVGDFASRRLWVEDDRVVQVNFMLEQVAMRLDLSPAEASRCRLPAPALGSASLEQFLDRQGAVRVSAPSTPEPPTPAAALDDLWRGGCLVMRREHEVPDGCLWFGLLPRERLPERTAMLLDFEGGPEELPAGARSAIRLLRWPLWSWKGMEMVAVGGWHDWKLFFWSSEHGLWSYAHLPEQIDFVAGEIRTWLEILAVEDELAEAERLAVEIAFSLGGRRERGRIAERLGLRPVPACTDRSVSSYEGDGLWMREITPPVGKPFCVARCDGVDRALALVDPIGEAGSMRPQRVAISAWSAGRTELAQELGRRGMQTRSSNRQWWSDFRRLWRV